MPVSGNNSKINNINLPPRPIQKKNSKRKISSDRGINSSKQKKDMGRRAVNKKVSSNSYMSRYKSVKEIRSSNVAVKKKPLDPKLRRHSSKASMQGRGDRINRSKDRKSIDRKKSSVEKKKLYGERSKSKKISSEKKMRSNSNKNVLPRVPSKKVFNKKIGKF